MSGKKINSQQYQHIILVSLDSLRSDCITAVNSDFPNKFYTGSQFKTTMLDYLIKHGMYFSNCISAAPYTSASHAAYFTGCWPRRNGVYEFFNRQIGRPTLFELAQRENIYTIFQTDFPIILGDSLGFTRGVNKYFIESESAAFSELIKHKNRNTVSFFHFGGIHYPYGFHKLKFARVDFPKKVRELEGKFNIEQPVVYTDILDESYREGKDRELLLRYKTIVDTLYSRGDYQSLHQLYVNGIDYFLKHRFNRFIRKVIDFVDHTNSLLIVFADHGENWAADSRGHSNAINDPVLRVPVILYGNGVRKNMVITDLIRTIDVVPTIYQCSKIASADFDGLPIDLANPKDSIGSREAFAQVWRVGDRMKIYKHQQRILKSKKMIRPLATKLEKEAVYYGRFTLNREYSKDGTLARESFYKNTGKRLVVAKKGFSKKKMNLKNRLKKYNQIKYNNSQKISKVNQSIIDDLHALGYYV